MIRRFRLHEAAAHATAGGDVDWARLAITLGYYDQAHLVRDFTATVGTAPARYAAGAEGGGGGVSIACGRARERVVVALGGNAIAGERGADPESQQHAVEGACEQIAELVDHGHEVAITHGNGPQVGNLLLKNDLARDVVPPVPLDWCVAQTQATLGFLIVTALEAALARPPRRARSSRACWWPPTIPRGAPTKPIGRYVERGRGGRADRRRRGVGGRAASAAGGAWSPRRGRWRSSTAPRSRR